MKNVKIKRARPLLGTFVTIELEGAADVTTMQVWINAGFAAIDDIEQLMSIHRPDSDITRLNHAAPGEWVELNPLTQAVLKASNTLFDMSGGIFDIRSVAVPAASCAPVEFRETAARKTGPWSFDLGGIAKGFAVDHAAERIQTLAARYKVSGSVNAGGDLRCWGRRAVPAATEVRGQGAHWLQPFVIRETAAATSSVRSAADEDLAPAVHRQMPSAIPLEKEQTVTVFADQCLWADALTKIVLMASEKIARTCLSAFNAKAVVFRPDGGLQTVMD